MPAPQVVSSNVQMHSAFCTSVELAGTWQDGGGVGFVLSMEVCGKGWLPSCSRAMSSLDLRLLFTANISAAIPDTIGAEKLVPRFVLVWSV